MVLTLTMTFRKISDTFTMALRLLPASNAAAYAELVLASEASEGLVNGIWNSYESYITFIDECPNLSESVRCPGF